MVEPEIPLVPERFFPDSTSRIRVRVGQTVRRTSYSWSPAVLDLLQHLCANPVEAAALVAALQ